MAFPFPSAKRLRVEPLSSLAGSSDRVVDMQNISLTEDERKFFDMLRNVVSSEGKNTVVRVAGGYCSLSFPICQHDL